MCRNMQNIGTGYFLSYQGVVHIRCQEIVTKPTQETSFLPFFVDIVGFYVRIVHCRHFVGIADSLCEKY